MLEQLSVRLRLVALKGIFLHLSQIFLHESLLFL